jgi:hypothetical protein
MFINVMGFHTQTHLYVQVMEHAYQLTIVNARKVGLVINVNSRIALVSLGMIQMSVTGMGIV